MTATIAPMPPRPALAEALREARDSFAGRHPISRRLFDEACAYMPGGNTRTVLFHEPFPLRIARGDPVAIDRYGLRS